MFKTFIILKYFLIQTSAIKRKYPTLIVRVFFVSACTHSISRYIHIQTLCIHKRNVLRFLQHGTSHVVVRGGSYFCQSPEGGGSGVFSLKRKGGPTFPSRNSPALPPTPRKNVPSLITLALSCITLTVGITFGVVIIFSGYTNVFPCPPFI